MSLVLDGLISSLIQNAIYGRLSDVSELALPATVEG